MYKLTQCSNCGITSYLHPEGDGCHSCCRGSMRMVFVLKDRSEYSLYRGDEKEEGEEEE